MILNNILNQKFYNMAKVKRRTKNCSITNRRFPVAQFYKNPNTTDGYHPYSKVAGNFRRRLKGTSINTQELRKMFNELNLKLA